MKRMAWTACVLVVSSLGISAMLAGGCGGDDTAPPPGTGGSGGSAGSGASGSKAGSAGTGGGASGAGGGGSGTAVTTDSGSDAPAACMPAKTTPTAMEKAICTGGLIGDSAASCVTTCLCTQCPKEAVACLGDARCKAVVDCAAATGCSSVAECLKPEKCGAVLAEAGPSLPAVVDFQCCGATCQTLCAGDIGPGTDAKADAPASDAPAADAPASDATTSDAPADAAAADADNEGG